ncbi:MAG: aminoglycoside phosphotransferase family protein [Clostridia bacterium]|nr:aminoglycoside phosphotransferase family protein [Clostridia bacterium]
MYPEKWRETCDPFALPFTEFRLTEILGYPHAGNDVFRVRGIYRGEEVTAYIKAARNGNGSAPGAILREAALLKQLEDPLFPKLIDCGAGDIPFSVTLEMPGERLSAILGDNIGLASMEYLAEYGEALARLHRLHIEVPPVPDRRFFHAPGEEILSRFGLSGLSAFFASAPKTAARCFCHGDCHYANVLFAEKRVSAILDFELAGFGDRDFDIAWALFLRPGQRFLRTDEERREFLRGYARIGKYDINAVRFYMAQCYAWFLPIGADDADYCEYALNEIKKFCM